MRQYSKRAIRVGMTMVAALSAAMTSTASAQPCPVQWQWNQGGVGVPGIDGPVHALAVSTSGNIIAGGWFRIAGDVTANRIARWNGTSWSPLGSGMVGQVWALAVLPNGDIVAGGNFTSAGGVSVNRIARWDGAVWAPLGAGLNNEVTALQVLPNGDLIAGGSFTASGSVALNRVGRWNGTSWSALGPGMSDSVSALTVLPNGDIVAGGSFTTAGFVTANRIARWDGASWTPMASGMNAPVRALAALPNGELVAGGLFTSAGGTPANRVARWNRGSWTALGAGVGISTPTTPAVDALVVLPNGDLIAGGNFTSAGSVPANYIARWDGTSWAALGTGMTSQQLDSPVFAVAQLPSGDIVAGGSFIIAGNVAAQNIASCSLTFSNIPTATLQPSPQVLSEGQTLTLTARPGDNLTGVSVQWRRNGALIANGPGGASVGGGVVSGAVESLPTPTLNSYVTLTVANAQLGDSGSYSAIFTNACGTATTTSAAVTVVPIACSPADIANTDGDFGPDGVIDNGDFFAFFAAFFAGCR